MSILTSNIDELACLPVGAYEISSEYYMPAAVQGWWLSMKDVPENQFSCHTHLFDLLNVVDGHGIRIEVLHDGYNIVKCLYHVKCETFAWIFEFSPVLLPIEINEFIRTRDTSLLNGIPGFISIDLHEPEIEYVEHAGFRIARYKK